MNLRHLECFTILAEELNFRKAAERCMLTQPALSQQLRLLEEELEAVLVFRTNRQVRLTPSGEVFLKKTKEILEQIKETKELVRQMERGKTGVVTVGATIPATYILLSDIIIEMKKRMPEVEVIVREMNTPTQEEALRRNRIDIGLGHPPFEDKTLTSSNISKIPFDVVMYEGNPLADKTLLSMKDLENETFILFPRKLGPLQYDNIISLCLQSGFSPKNIIEVAPAQAIISFAGSGLGIGFIASKLQQFQHPHVVYRQINGTRPYFALGTIHRREKLNHAVKIFKKIAEEIGNKAK